ncbi:hypothetical protein ACTQZS_08100 [Bilifractor sp. LCP19S3_H10]|uniref:hypothetical protein n=1 Tax=Bilifractor sp. LCP19S3_H10 TaxID=3438736 RepID=UPI003F920BA6
MRNYAESSLYQQLTYDTYRDLKGPYSEEALQEAFSILQEIEKKKYFDENCNIRGLEEKISEILPNRCTYMDASSLVMNAMKAFKDSKKDTPFGDTEVTFPSYLETAEIRELSGDVHPRAIYKIANKKVEDEETEWMEKNDISPEPDDSGSVGVKLLFHGSPADTWVSIITDARLDATKGKGPYGMKSRSFGSIEDEYGVEQGNYYSDDLKTAMSYGATGYEQQSIVGVFAVPVGKMCEVALISPTRYDGSSCSETTVYTETHLKEMGCDSLKARKEIVARRGVLKYLLLI